MTIERLKRGHSELQVPKEYIIDGTTKKELFMRYLKRALNKKRLTKTQ